MNAREFHCTPIGAKVLASIGNYEHVAKVLDKSKDRKFLLKFHLANGDARREWRSALRCSPTDHSRPMGTIRRNPLQFPRA